MDTSDEAKHVVLGCKMVLAASSEYFRARLLSDLEDGAKEFSLVVEEGEADAALAVIQTMYTGIPEGLSASELVTMWKVADRLQATSAAIYTKTLCEMELDLDTVMMVRGKAWCNPKVGLDVVVCLGLLPC